METIKRKPVNDTIHLEFIDEDKDVHYLCNQACLTTASKRTTDKEKVTCLNCLRVIKRNEVKL